MRSRSRRSRTKSVVLRVVGIVVLALAVLYIAGLFYFQKHFVWGTKINGVACSMRSVAGAENRITQVVQNFEIRLKERQDQTETLNGKDFSMDVVFDDSMNGLLDQQNAFAWPISFLRPAKVSVGVTVSYDASALAKAVSDLDCMQDANETAPVSASLAYDTQTKEYGIEPEDVGTTINESALLAAVQECVVGLHEKLDLEEEGCYVDPEYSQDDEAVVQAQETANRYVGVEVTYDYDVDQVVVDADQIAEWIKISEDFKVSFDKDKVQQFVSSMAEKYDTIYTTRTFHTSYDYDITVSQGDYGWWTNRVAERKSLIAFIKEGKSGTKEPVYYQKGVQRGDDDIGDTYVEVNLTRQHVLLYKDGKVVDEADCVSGKRSTPTPAGIYSVTYKDHTYDDHQVELVGEDYSSKVQFFIPFCGNVGFHDASWRKSFGGSQYLTRGSHGCVNLPYHMAESIYNTVEKGMPVIVYEDPNVPSATTQEATTES